MVPSFARFYPLKERGTRDKHSMNANNAQFIE